MWLTWVVYRWQTWGSGSTTYTDENLLKCIEWIENMTWTFRTVQTVSVWKWTLELSLSHSSCSDWHYLCQKCDFCRVFFKIQCLSWIVENSLLLLCPRVQWRSIVISSVCLCVCLSARISPEPHAWSLPNFSACCLWPWSVLLRQGDKISRGRGNLGVFLSTDNAL